MEAGRAARPGARELLWQGDRSERALQVPPLRIRRSPSYPQHGRNQRRDPVEACNRDFPQGPSSSCVREQLHRRTSRTYEGSCHERPEGDARWRRGTQLGDEPGRYSSRSRGRARSAEEKARRGSTAEERRGRKGEEEEPRKRRELWRRQEEEKEGKEEEKREEEDQGRRIRQQQEQKEGRRKRTSKEKPEEVVRIHGPGSRPSGKETSRPICKEKDEKEQREVILDKPEQQIQGEQHEQQGGGGFEREQPHQAAGQVWSRSFDMLLHRPDEGEHAGDGRELWRRRGCSASRSSALREGNLGREAERRSPERSADDRCITGPTADGETKRGGGYDGAAPQKFGTGCEWWILGSRRETRTDTPGNSQYEVKGRDGGCTKGTSPRWDSERIGLELQQQRRRKEQEREDGRQEEGARQQQEWLRSSRGREENGENEGSREDDKKEASPVIQCREKETQPKNAAQGNCHYETAEKATAVTRELLLPDCTAPFWQEAEGAATPSLKIFVSTQPDAEEKVQQLFSREGGFEDILKWLDSRIGGFLARHCKTKPSGGVFPLPTSIPTLATAITSSTPSSLKLLRCVCLSLNSLNGEGVWGRDFVSPFQSSILSFLHEQVLRVLSWNVAMEPMSWKEFLNVKTVDYKGDEVHMAQSVQWENIAPALPQEVGRVPLESVVEQGCKYYVNHFDEFLHHPEDQHLGKAPRVMVPPEGWEKFCDELIKLGLCDIMHEEEVYKVGGQPLLNGLFGVSKGEFEGSWETMRLIMNLIPLNGLCKGLEGDVATLPSWASMSGLHLMPDENLVVFSEDVRCFFYIFRVPRSWYRFLCFNRPLPRRLCGSKPGCWYMCATVLPMGFKNSVSIAQHVHRVIVKRALDSSRLLLGAEAELRKDRAFPSSRDMIRIYLDNFDEMKKADDNTAKLIEGKPSPVVLALREEYLRLGVPRHPKKSVEERRLAEVQGAIVDGVAGIAYPKPEKVLKYCRLAVMTLERGTCTQKEAQILGGGFVYLAMFRRPLLGGLNALWLFITSFEGLPPFIRKDLPDNVKEELARMVGLAPLAVMSFRSKIS